MAFVCTADYPPAIGRMLSGAALGVAAVFCAIVVWAALAPLATSLTLSGRIASAQPVYDVETEFAGRIDRLHVHRLQEVAVGDPLLDLDTDALDRRRTALDARIAMLRMQNAALREEDVDLPPTLAAAALVAWQAERERALSHAATMDRLAAEIGQTEAQIDALAIEVAAYEALHVLAQDEAGRTASLIAAGSRPASDLARMERERIEATRALAGVEARRAAALAELHSLKLQQTETDLRHDAETAARLRDNAAALIDLERELAEVRRQIAAAHIVAPRAGVLSDLPAPTAGLILGPGDVLARISEPLAEVEIAVTVPPHYIDQVRIGQRGVLVLPGLARARMPRIEVTLTALAGSAEEDRDGNATGYVATAVADAAQIAAAAERLGDEFRLVRDMPASVLLEGRSTTPLGYFLQPFHDIARGAFEAG